MGTSSYPSNSYVKELCVLVYKEKQEQSQDIQRLMQQKIKYEYLHML